jgi:iron complex transport system permease protein
MGAILALFADLLSLLAVNQMVLPFVTWVILRRNSQKSFPSS